MKLKEIADCRGLSGPIVFAVDSQSIPGTIIVHSVRLETALIDDAAFDNTKFKMLHSDSDKRIPILAECCRGK